MPSWILEVDRVVLDDEFRPLPGEDSASAPSRVTFTHHFEPQHVLAINAALAAGRPLLVRGEPGVGKSQLARAAAKGLGRAFVSRVIDARAESQDLLWSFDAVRRLADAQVLRADDLGSESVQERLADRLYVQPGPLWWGFDWKGAKNQAEEAHAPMPPGAETADASRGVVVLLDEIDKADSSLPNGLLECMGHRQFPGPAGSVVNCGAIAPLVVLTTNEERALPDAFLRRCLVLQMVLPATEVGLVEWLKSRGRAHFDESQIDDELLAEAAAMLVEDRKRAERRGLSPPGGAEYLDLLRALAFLGRDAGHRGELLAEIRSFAFRKHPEDRSE